MESAPDPKKTGCEGEVNIKYTGVQRRKSGKFFARISDVRKGTKVCLGTYDSAIEAAKAYDEAAFLLRGTKASLNFPLDYGVSREVSRKDAMVVEGKDNGEFNPPREKSNAAAKTEIYALRKRRNLISPEESTKMETNSVLRSGRKRRIMEGKHKGEDIDSNKVVSILPDDGIAPDVSERKTSEDNRETTAVVVVNTTQEERKLNGGHIDTITLLDDDSGPSAPSSAPWSSRSVSLPPRSISPHRQSPLIGISESAKGENFNWTDANLVIMCDILNKQLVKNGRNSRFNWVDLHLEFQQITHNSLISNKAVRSKYEAMKQRYNLWKLLMKGENGLRWNESAGTLDCSDDWWDKKIKEGPEFSVLRKRQPSRKLQEAWDQLFGHGVDCVAPALVDPNHVNLEDDVEHDNVSPKQKPKSSQFGNLETEKPASFSNFINEVRREDASTAKHADGCKPPQKFVKTSTKSKCSLSPKCNTKESEKATMLKEFVQQNAARQSVLKIMKAKPSSVNEVGSSSISAAVGVINRMVGEGLMVSCSELWCFAVNLFEDNVKRELFLSLPNDDGRLAWLRYKLNLCN